MTREWAALLLVKLPRLDVTWTPAVQAQWWQCWRRLLDAP